MTVEEGSGEGERQHRNLKVKINYLKGKEAHEQPKEDTTRRTK